MYFSPVILLLIAALMLALALGTRPYSYYEFLRIFVFLVCGYSSWFALRVQNRRIVPFLLACLAIMFNPIWRIRMALAQWRWFDALSAVVLAAFAIMMWQRAESKTADPESDEARERLRENKDSSGR
jgi:hypothetical protein